MQETRARQKFDNYDLEKAFSLLGPKNYGSFSPKSLSDHLILIIRNFVKTFFRTINFIFGDHQWYNHKTAHKLLVKYYRNPVETPEVAVKIDRLYNELFFRGTGYFRSFSSIADDLHEVRQTYLNNINLANQSNQAITNPIDQLISQPINPPIDQPINPPISKPIIQPISKPIDQPIPQPINQTIDQLEEPNKGQVEEPNDQPDDQLLDDQLIDPSVSRIYSNQDEISIDDSDDEDELISYIKVPNAPRKSYPPGIQQCGNLSMQSVFEDWKKMASEFGDEITDAQILKLVQDAEEDLINYQPQLFPNKKVSKEKAIKAYQNLADFLSPRRSPIGEEQINTHFDQRYLQAYDPYELFSLASFIAAKELKISRLNSEEYDRSEDWFSVFKLTVFNLISQAELRTDACGAHGGQYLNINNSTFSHTRYQKPIIVYKRSNDGSYEPQTLFNTDLFSSTYVGCDPDAPKD